MLVAILDAPDVSESSAVLAGDSLSSIERQRFGQQRSLSFLAELRSRMLDRSRRTRSRVGAAIPLLRGEEQSDVQLVLDRIRDTSEEIEFRELLLAGCTVSSPMPVWLGAVWELGRRERKQSLIKFVVERALTDEDERIRQAAASALMYEPEAIDDVASRLRDSSQSIAIRLAACDALRILKADRSRAVLLEIISRSESDHELVLRAAMVLSELIDDNTAASLEELILTATDERSAIAAAMVVARSSRSDVLDHLRTLCLTAANLDDARRAIDALGWAAQVTAVALDRLLSISLEANQAVVRIAGGIRAHAFAPEKTVSTLAATLADITMSGRVRERSALVLAFIHSEAAVQALQDIRNSVDVIPHIRASAAFALAYADQVRTEELSPLEWLTLHLNCHMDFGSWDQALADCTNIIAASTNNDAFYRLRAVCLAALHRQPEALDDALKARELNPKAVENHQQVANLYEETGRYAEAVTAARGALEADEKDGYSWLILGWCLYKAGSVADSIDASKRGALLLPDEPVALLNMGLALLAQGTDDAAYEKYEAAILVSSRIDARDGHAALRSGLDDLKELLSRRPELIAVAQRSVTLLQQGVATEVQ
jgi:tetratricopeptide (TPR) repeat protein